LVPPRYPTNANKASRLTLADNLTGVDITPLEAEESIGQRLLFYGGFKRLEISL
jgi:hypothetical protein